MCISPARTTPGEASETPAWSEPHAGVII